MEFGYLRETDELAIKAGKDPTTGLSRTGLDFYLKVIYPDVGDWVHDKCIPNSGSRKRPDYRSEVLKTIVEYDGLPHYQNPEQSVIDEVNTKFYTDLGYKVIRIPYFIQLSNKVVKKLFGVDVNLDLFDESYPSLSVANNNTPGHLCIQGIYRMSKEFKEISPEQYQVNLNKLKSEEYNYEFTGIDQLEYFYSVV